MEHRAQLQAGSSIPVSINARDGDPYREVLSAIRAHTGSIIAVPELSLMLGVKSTTLNARLRRQQVEVSMVGRTSYISCQLALQLAELHKYALFGWPTLREASRATKVKACTIKARCEKGQLEGHRDLTKRLRLNPEALASLRIRSSAEQVAELPAPADGRTRSRNPHPLREPTPVRATHNSAKRHLNSQPGKPVHVATPLTQPARSVPPVAQPVVRLVTARDYGLPEAVPSASVMGRKDSSGAPRYPGVMIYDPDRPPCVSECLVGSIIHYGPNRGQIVQVLDDPFTPRIKVHFPEHAVAVMREVLLSVGRQRR